MEHHTHLEQVHLRAKLWEDIPGQRIEITEKVVAHTSFSKETLPKNRNIQNALFNCKIVVTYSNCKLKLNILSSEWKSKAAAA